MKRREAETPADPRGLPERSGGHHFRRYHKDTLRLTDFRAVPVFTDRIRIFVIL